MIEVKVDQKELKELYMQEIKKRLDQLDNEITFWDAKELKRQTNMSWNTIQDKFFFDPDFPKFKVGNKWYFPSEKTKEFLNNWIAQQTY
ncbi:group-specific protein [Thalassobacillus sp. C254]|uniref:group-specific protein n=1 Tax=Thalassobacillus sp. C254 TaxID=1225341 RepID=UPI0006D1970C|nr:group-specific protein [Thalassobacillus sp. C254]